MYEEIITHNFKDYAKLSDQISDAIVNNQIEKAIRLKEKRYKLCDDVHEWISKDIVIGSNPFESAYEVNEIYQYMLFARNSVNR